MLRRSLFVSSLAAMLMSLACAAPSQAGSVTVETFAAITPGNVGSTATDMEITYSGIVTGPLTSIVETGGLVGATTSILANVVTIQFTGPASSGSIMFDFASPTPVPGAISVTNLSLSGVVNSSLTNPIGVKGGSQILGVPEPGSMALLGIGVTGLLAFRRLFKRPSVV